MGPLAAVERFLERLFERQSARIFKTAIRPVQVQRRLERVMEGDRSRDGARTVVPHRFVVRLHPDDLAGLRASTPGLAALLADAALAFARSHSYTILDRPVVAIRSDPLVAPGDIAVDAADPHAVAAERDDPLPLDEAASDGRLGAAVGDQTAVFVIPDVDGPRATIREIRPDQSSRSIAFDGRPLTIGRAADNRLVLRDGRASRHHARIDGRRGSLVLSDLGSTNGSFVNDRRVDSIALGEGDRIRIGTTTLLIEAIDTGAPEARERAGQSGQPDAPAIDPSDGELAG